MLLYILFDVTHFWVEWRQNICSVEFHRLSSPNEVCFYRIRIFLHLHDSERGFWHVRALSDYGVRTPPHHAERGLGAIDRHRPRAHAASHILTSPRRWLCYSPRSSVRRAGLQWLKTNVFPNRRAAQGRTQNSSWALTDVKSHSLFWKLSLDFCARAPQASLRWLCFLISTSEIVLSTSSADLV